MPTAFEEKVYEITSKIPLGKVTTYKVIADKLKTSPRAVGNALAKNPYAPQVPCHRVIKSTGEIGGFKGNSSKYSSEKVRLLLAEGVEIKTDRTNPLRVRPYFWHPD